MYAPTSFDRSSRLFRRYHNSHLLLCVVSVLLLALSTLVLVFPSVRAWASGGGKVSVTASPSAPPRARLSEGVSVRAAGRGAPFVNLSDGRELVTAYEGAPELVSALEQQNVQPLALASADFDEDGTPDLISAYANTANGGGIITLHRGNVDAIYPNAPEAQARKAGGTFTDAPFLSPARTFEIAAAPDFIGAGDFDGDSHWDVVAANRGGDRLYLLAGDGNGLLHSSRTIELPGAVTALTTGEINRRDGLTDVVVGLDGKKGAQVLVFEGPEGALRAQPEAFSVNAPVTSLALGQLDGGYEMDLAVASGNELLIVHGRDRKLSLDAELQSAVRPARAERRSFPVALVSLAIGDFMDGQSPDIALLAADGTIQVLSDGSQLDDKEREIKRLAAWESRTVGIESDMRSRRLLALKMSSVRGDDLLMTGEDTPLLRVLSNFGSEGAPSQLTIESERATGAALPLRLNSDVFSDLVLLEAGKSAPNIVPTTATTFVVNTASDTDDGTCTTAHCSLREAINAANVNLGSDAISFNIGTGFVRIALNSDEGLPTITESVTIDGTTQPGFAGTPLVELTRGVPCLRNAMTISAGSSVVRGLSFRNVNGVSCGRAAINLNTNGGNIIEGNAIGNNAIGVEMNSPNNMLGGTASAASNNISGNADQGALVSAGTVMQGNLFEGNGDGVEVFGGNTVIGGTVAGARNVINFTRDSFGLRVSGSGTLIQGNYIGVDRTGNFDAANMSGGAIVNGSNNTVGGTVSAARNVISGRSSPFAIRGLGVGGDNNQVQGNFIGTNASGTAGLGNQVGLEISGSGNAVGGTVAGARNVISANGNVGIQMVASGSAVSLIQGNFIGTDVTGSQALGNVIGISPVVSSTGAGIKVGGETPEARNIISGNRFDGIAIGGTNGDPVPMYIPGGSGIQIEGNYIGTDVTGTSSLGNGNNGILVNTRAFSNTIKGNLIANNGFGPVQNGPGGVRISNTTQADPNGTPSNRIRLESNLIYANGGLGINLGDDGITLNDPLDTDGGANLQQNFPVLTAITPSARAVRTEEIAPAGSDRFSDGRRSPRSLADTVTVSSTLNSAPNTTFTIHWYFSEDAQCTSNQSNNRPLAFGRVPGVQTDGNGNANFSFPFAFPTGVAGGVINCTATDPDGNTSEFSACFPVTAPPPARGTLQLGAATYSFGEGGGTALLPVTRTGGSSGAVSVAYATTNGTATAGQDYTDTSGVLDFADGQTSRDIAIPIAPDTLDETDETINITLSNLTGGASLGTPNTAVLTINDDDAPPALSINDVSVNEGDSGTVNAVFTVSLSAASGRAVTVNYATADSTATAGSDYTATANSLMFNPGETTKNVAVPVNGDAAVEATETFFVNLSGATNATISDAQGIGTINNDDIAAPTVQFAAGTVNFSEGDSRATLTLTRSGDASATLSVAYATIDNPAAVPCNPQLTTERGLSYARCDYATSIDTVTFAAGDVQPKQITIPLIDDAHVEGAETFQVALSTPSAGATLGSQANATVTITDNDTNTNAPNPISATPLFVRLHYLDFLSREPEAGEPWSAILNGCPNVFNLDPQSPSANCDRILVSQSFFGSPEFRLKGFYVFIHYRVAFNRLAEYAEIVVDLRQVTGVTPEDTVARRAQFPISFTQRTEFRTAYDALTNAVFVDALLGRYGLSQIITPDPANPEGGPKVTLTRSELTNRLNANTLTRAQVLRAIVESDEVSAAEFNRAFVATQYYGYLRRTPEQPGYDEWLDTIGRRGESPRVMVNGFMNSPEYQLRFGRIER